MLKSWVLLRFRVSPIIEFHRITVTSCALSTRLINGHDYDDTGARRLAIVNSRRLDGRPIGPGRVLGLAGPVFRQDHSRRAPTLADVCFRLSDTLFPLQVPNRKHASAPARPPVPPPTTSAPMCRCADACFIWTAWRRYSTTAPVRLHECKMKIDGNYEISLTNKLIQYNSAEFHKYITIIQNA